MIKDVKLNDFPRCSGVYWITDVNGAVIYVGSSNNLYQRMGKHRSYIKAGSNKGYQKDLYEYLQKNEFKIAFELTDDYRKYEQYLIEKHNPRFNQKVVYTSLDRKAYIKAYWETHKEEKKQYYKKYRNKKCLYNGEILKLNALSMRFKRQGFEHPTAEAKKYLIDIKGVEK